MKILKLFGVGGKIGFMLKVLDAKMIGKLVRDSGEPVNSYHFLMLDF